MARIRLEGRAAQLLSAAAGVACAYLLHASLHQPAPLKWPTPAKAKVSFRAAPAPSAPAVAAVVKTDAILPLKTEAPVKAPPAKAKKRVAPAPLSPTSATAPEAVAQVLPTLSQPALPIWRPGASLDSVPLIPSVQAAAEPAPLGPPPLPSDVPEFRSGLAAFETPGGDVLVLALLVNDAGLVVDSSIVVPSSFALHDISMAFTYVGQQWLDIDPPMLPGEYRWFEIRVDHYLRIQRESILP